MYKSCNYLILLYNPAYNKISMSFIQRNCFRLVLAFAALVLVFSVAYYLAVPLPKYENQMSVQQNSNALAQNQSACADMAGPVKQSYIAGGYEVSNSDALDVQNHYNTSQKTCFVEITDSACNPNGVCSTAITIYNGVENNPLYHCISFADGTPTSCASGAPAPSSAGGGLSVITQNQFNTILQRDMTE